MTTATALITGGSRGLGAALAKALSQEGWKLVITGRAADRLEATAGRLGARAVQGDITDPDHRNRLAEAVRSLGGLGLLINNASELGPSPLPSLAELDPNDLRRVIEVNLLAPHALIRQLVPELVDEGVVINVSSDAAVEAYPGWGGYGASKAALDHLTAVWGAEQPSRRFYSVDPGDMRTDMHQAAFPGEDITDRPLPSAVAPGFLELLRQRPASGRYRAEEFVLVSS